MHIAALPVSFEQHFDDGPLEPGMIVADSAQAASFQTKKELFPTCRTLPIGHLHAEHLTSAIPINPDGHKHRSRADHCVLPHFLIPRVEDQIGILTLELSTGKAPEFLVEFLVEPTYCARAKTVPAELFTDRFGFPSRYSLDVHLCKCGYQSLLTALIAFEYLGGKPSITEIRNSQLEFAYPRNQAARVIAASVA